MQTQLDLRIGSLVRWNGDDDNGADIDELGIVIQMPGENWDGNYHIAWAISNGISHHSPDMVEESLYQQQMEIIR